MLASTATQKNYSNPQGTVYITEGNGAVPVRSFSTTPFQHQWVLASAQSWLCSSVHLLHFVFCNKCKAVNSLMQ